MVLSRGNTEDLATMYEAWLGSAPKIDPMLKYRGWRRVDEVGLTVGRHLVFEAGGQLCETLHLAFFFVDVLNGDDAAGDFAVGSTTGRRDEADPGAGAVAVVTKIFAGTKVFTVHDGVGERSFRRRDIRSVGEKDSEARQ